MTVWPQTECKKYWRNLNLAVMYYIIINIARAFIRSIAVLSFEVLELSREFADLQEI